MYDKKPTQRIVEGSDFTASRELEAFNEIGRLASNIRSIISFTAVHDCNLTTAQLCT